MVIPSKRFIIFGSIISALAWSNYGIQAVLFNLTEPIFMDFINESLRAEFHFDPSSSYVAMVFAILTSFTYIGVLIAFAGGNLGNVIGRKPVIMLIMPISTIVGSILMSVAYPTNSVIPLIMGRILNGLSAAFTCFVTVPYVIEFTPKETKGFLPSFHSVYTQGWGLIIMVLSLPQTLGTAELWPWLVAVPILPSIFLLLAFFVAPESPGWLYVQRNDAYAARAALERVYRHDEVVIDEVIEELSVEKEISGSQLTIKQLLVDPGMRRSLIISAVIASAANVSGQVINSQFSTSMMTQVGLPGGPAEKMTIIAQAAILLGSFICPVLTRNFGYRTVFLGLLTSAFLFGIGMYGFVALFKVGYLTDPMTTMILAAICLCMNNFSYGAGLGPLGWFYMSELQMTSARTTANVILFIAMTILVLVVSFLYPVLQDVIGISAYPILVSLPTFPFMIYLYLNLPETKNKSSAEIYDIMTRQAKSKSHFKACIPYGVPLDGSESTPLISKSE